MNLGIIGHLNSVNSVRALDIVGSIFSIQRVQYQHAYVGTAVTMNNTPGNTLIGMLSYTGTGTGVFSDTNGNTWTFVNKVVYGNQDSMTVAIATNINSGSNVISATGYSSDPGITVIEYTPCSLLSSSIVVPNGQLPLSCSQAFIPVAFWANERNPEGTVACIFQPGNIPMNQIQYGTGHFDAQWDQVNSGSGFPAGNYYIEGTATAGTSMWIGVALG